MFFLYRLLISYAKNPNLKGPLTPRSWQLKSPNCRVHIIYISSFPSPYHLWLFIIFSVPFSGRGGTVQHSLITNYMRISKHIHMIKRLFFNYDKEKNPKLNGSEYENQNLRDLCWSTFSILICIFLNKTWFCIWFIKILCCTCKAF